MDKTILVVDDEAQTLEMLQMLLEMYGYEVLLAANGQEALEVYERRRPPIVLTDIKMPIMDSMEVLARIKELNPMAEVIVITGHGDMDLAIKALNLDATDFVNKPVQRKVLDQALKRADERIRMARNNEDMLQLELQPQSALIRVRGSLTSASEAFLNQIFAKALAADPRRIAVLFEKNASINGSGIALLTHHLVECQDKGVAVSFVGLNDNLRRVIDIVGISGLVNLCQTLEEALQPSETGAAS